MTARDLKFMIPSSLMNKAFQLIESRTRYAPYPLVLKEDLGTRFNPDARLEGRLLLVDQGAQRLNGIRCVRRFTVIYICSLIFTFVYSLVESLGTHQVLHQNTRVKSKPVAGVT